MPDSSLSQPSGPAARRWVACLCADWCGTCRDYRPVFDQMAAEHPGMPFLWLDIEDQAALVGDLDIETFPTLLVADGAALRFAGPMLPHAGTLARLLDSLEAKGTAIPVADAALGALVQALYRQLSSA
ncbi:thioredoxin family protein [Polaromonas sp. A23]|uniref:thioredoxin family protein n=1 Tax=Polaromonas sp. A23 TaxID=1944133 RepID=UPI0009850E35|nr:thioredoxin family protein [Polaromonas sp. A23]OOG47646.1 thiol reductase thioredoxin [Polaromonas sp. A23]